MVNASQFPADFRRRMMEQLGEEYNRFEGCHETLSPVSVRKNPYKETPLFSGCEKVEWATNAFYLPERISFTLDPLFHAGCYYVQEASSMYIEKIASSFFTGKPLKVLDLCAAPGGKSTHLLSLLPEGSLLVSNEIVPSRNKILQQNILKWGCANIIVTQNEAGDFSRLEGYFDIILVDAPCSGEGLFRKDPDAVEEWSAENVRRCTLRQHDILGKIIPSLVTGGVLIYSTCTYGDEENDNAGALVCASGAFDPIRADHHIPGVVNTRFGTQFYPHKVKGEGFYIAAFRKNSEVKSPKIKTGNIFSTTLSKVAGPWLDEAVKFSMYENNGEVYAIPSSIEKDFAFLKSSLFVRMAGIHMGTVMRSELVPSHRLALSRNVSKGTGRIFLDHDTALRYLRCETIPLSGEPKGWYLASYGGHAIGWIKQLGNRMNNYLPKEYRILMK